VTLGPQLARTLGLVDTEGREVGRDGLHHAGEVDLLAGLDLEGRFPGLAPGLRRQEEMKARLCSLWPTQKPSSATTDCTVTP